MDEDKYIEDLIQAGASDEEIVEALSLFRQRGQAAPVEEPQPITPPPPSFMGFQFKSNKDEDKPWYLRSIIPTQAASEKMETLGAVGEFPSTVGHVAGQTLKSISIGGQAVERVFGVDKPIEEYPFYQAGEAIEQATDEAIPLTDEQKQSFLGKTSGALATVGTIMATGPQGLRKVGGSLLAKGAKYAGQILGRSASLTGLVAGSMTAVPEFEAAKEAGLSDKEAFNTFLLNYGVGQTDIFPIERAFGVLNAPAKNLATHIFKAMLTGAATEAVQEGIQTYLTNRIAEGSYDPDRDPMLGIWESMGYGALIGALIPGGLGLAAVRLKGETDTIIDNESDTGDKLLNQEIDKQTEDITKSIGAVVDESNQVSNEASNQALTTTPVSIPSIDQTTGEDITKEGEEFTFSDSAGEAKGTIVEDAASIQEIFAATDQEGNPIKGGKLYEKVIKALQDRGIKTVVVGAQSQGSQKTLDRLVEKGILSIDPKGDVKVGDQTTHTRFNITESAEESQSIKPTSQPSESQTGETVDSKVEETVNDPIRALELQAGMVTIDARGKAEPTGAMLGENLKGAERKATVVEQIADALRGKVETRGGVIDFQDSWNEKHPENPISNAEATAAWNLIKKAPKDKGPVVVANKSDLLRDQIRIAYNAKEKGVRKGQQLVNDKIKVIQQAVKDNKLTARQANALLTKLRNTSLFTPGSYSRLNTFIDKVVGDAQYAETLAKARSLQKRVKKFGRQKGGETIVAPYKTLAKEFAKLNPSDITDLDGYIGKANEIIGAFKPIGKGYSAPKTVDVQSYIDKNFKTQEETQDAVLEEVEDDTDKTEQLRTIAKNSNEQLSNKDLSGFDQESKKTIETIKSIDIDRLTNDELKLFIKTVDNIVTNDNLSNTGTIQAISEIQGDLTFLKDTIEKEKPIVKEIGWWSELFANPAFLIKRVFQNDNVEAAIRDMAHGRFISKGSNLEKIQDNIENLTDKIIKAINKKFNLDVRDTKNQVKLQLFGILKQARDESDLVKMKRNFVKTIRDLAEDRKEESEAWRNAYEPFEKINTYEELQVALKEFENKEKAIFNIWSHFRNNVYTKELEAATVKNAQRIHNKEIEPWDNYLPIVHTKVSDLSRTAEEIRNAERGNAPNKDITIKPKPSSTTLRRSLNLTEGNVYSSTPIGDWLSKFADTMQDNSLAYEQLKLSHLLLNPEFKNSIGGQTNLTMFADAMRRMTATQRGLNNSVTKNAYERFLKVVTHGFRSIGTIRALGSVSQYVKQPLVLVKTAFNLGGDADLLSKGIHAVADIRKNGKNSPWGKLIEQTSLASRGLRLGGTDRGTSEFYKFDKSAKRWFHELLEKGGVKVDKNTRKVMEMALVPADIMAARSSFIAYYLKSLRQQGVTDINETTEYKRLEEKERRLALAYAENMIEKTQTASNPAALSAIQSRTGSVSGDIMKNVYLPFSSFDADFKARLVSEIDAVVRNKDGRSVRELFGTVFEAAVYAAVSTVVIGAWREVIRKAIRALTGAIPPEKDEEKENQNRHKQFWSSFTQAVNPLAFGSIGQATSSKAINTLAYVLDTWEDPSMSKKEWLKDNAIVYEQRDGPWYENLGVYSSGIAPLVELGKQVGDNPIIGESIKVVDAYGNEKQVEVTPEIAYLWSLKAMTEGLVLIGLTEADVANAIRAVYREQLKNGNKIQLHTPKSSLKLKQPKRLNLKK